MKPLLIAQSMTDIDERFILGSMPPPMILPTETPARAKRRSPLVIFGSIAAALSGVLTVGLVVALLNMWNLNPFTPPDTTTSEDTSAEDTETETVTEAETEPEAPTVFSEGLDFALHHSGGYVVMGMGACKDADVVIPPTHEGVPVVGINEYAFYENLQLTSVYVPGSVIEIGTNAFTKCKNLIAVTLAEGVSEIGTLAFSGCTALTSITIPNSLTYVNSPAFQDCKALEYTIYDQAKYLGNAKNPHVLLVSCLNRDITACEAHENTRVIAGSAFDRCTKLASITVPDSIVSAGQNAFKGCDGLTYNSKSSALFLGNTENPFVILVSAASTDISGCDIPEGTRVIMPYAFKDCNRMTGVSIPDTVVFIGNSAFYRCEWLNAVSIPAGVTKIRASTFFYCIQMSEVRLPESLTVIEDKAFEDSGVSSIRFPEGLTYIGDAAFKSTWLAQVSLPDSVTFVGEHAFAECGKLTSLKLSAGLSSISAYTFRQCSGLTHAEIPEGVEAIGMHAFESCTSLTSVTFPSSLRRIDNGAFLNCSALTAVTIPEGVTHLGQNDVSGRGVFEDCAKLTAVYLPRSLTFISHGPFGDCTNLESVCYAGSEDEWKTVDTGDAWDACFPLGATLHFNSTP